MYRRQLRLPVCLLPAWLLIGHLVALWTAPSPALAQQEAAAAPQPPAPMLRLRPAMRDPFGAREVPDPQKFKRRNAAKLNQLKQTELHFIRTLCQPTQEQFQKLSKDADAAIDQIAGVLAAKHKGKDPRDLIGFLMHRSVVTHLPPEQGAPYGDEIVARQGVRRRAAIAGILTRLDRQLFLTEGQWRSIAKVLEENWLEAWACPKALLYGHQVMPQLPAHEILLVLNDVQRHAWHQVYKEGHLEHPAADLELLLGVQIPAERFNGEQTQQQGTP